MPAIVTEALTRRFRDRLAVDDVSLELPDGAVLALLGPNGAGKTTTVRLLNGVLTPDSGRSSVLGLDPVDDGDELRRRTGVLTENAGLDDRLTAAENLLFTARLRGWRGEAARTRVHEMLERFDMADRADDLCQGFSTGQRKRVALARALLAEPELLFLDEPTSGLDPTATRDVADLIRDLAREQGRTVVLATHFLGEAGQLATHMAVLSRGRLHAYGEPAALAKQFWAGLDLGVDLGIAADEATLTMLRGIDGVFDASAELAGARLHVADRSAVPHVVRVLTDANVDVFGVHARPRTLEDVYHEIEARLARGEELELR